MKRFTHLCLLVLTVSVSVWAQDANGRQQTTAAGIRIGERLSYNISFERYDSVGYAELFAASRGKLGNADAVELRMKLKTTGILSAAFYQIDIARTTYASAETGMPLLVKRQDLSGLSPRETVSNYASSPADGFDLVTLIYRARLGGGTGTFSLNEGDRIYNVALQTQGAERVKVDAGEFDTTVSLLQSEYLAEHGIQGLRINFSTDESRMPVMLRFKTVKGELRVVLSGVQIVEPEVETTPTPVPVATPKPVSTPKPTPTPYIDNQPLPAELGFPLGEKLTYRVTERNRPVGTVVIEAKERKLVAGEDSLLLSASVLSAAQGNGVLSNTDTLTARVNPETLAPAEISIKLSGPLAVLSETARFDQRAGVVNSGPDKVDAPVGTHGILSLLFAMRSFNLVPSKDLRNPVNDTRVAVYWQKKTYIFVLKPFESETITVNGLKIPAQKITVRTDIPEIDRLGLTIWLSDDPGRVPVKIALGTYEAELTAQSRNSLK